jgi:hypothetical protein
VSGSGATAIAMILVLLESREVIGVGERKERVKSEKEHKKRVTCRKHTKDKHLPQNWAEVSQMHLPTCLLLLLLKNVSTN